MPNLIQIKRSLTSATPGSLANGELAYTAAVDTLYIGSNGTVVPIGGRRTPGVLSANQALVANSTSGIDKVIVGNLVPTAVYANGSFGTTGQILASNGTAVYWTAPGGTGTVTEVNSGSGLAGGPITSSGTLSVLANNGIISNSTGVFVNGNNGITVTSSGVFADGANGISVDATGINVLGGSGLVVNTTGVHVLTSGDTTLIANSTGLYVNDATLSIATTQLTGDVALGTQTSGNYVATITAGVGITGSASAEGATPTIAVLANNGIVATSTGVFVRANNGINVTTDGVFAVGGNGVFVTATGLNVGPGSGIVVGADDVSVLANNGIVANSTGVFVRANTGIVANSTGVFVNSAALSIATSQLTGDVALGTQTSGNYVATITAGAGITGSASAEGATPTIAVLANNGIVSNTTGVFVRANNGISVTADGVFAVGGNGLFVSATGLNIGGANGIITDADTIQVRGSPTVVVNATGLHVNTNLSITDLSLSGNLTVSGTMTIVDTQNLAVNDSIIELARNNAADILDIGFFGQYNDGIERYTGLIWDTSADVFELFTNTTVIPTTTVDTAGLGYTRATLRSFLNTGAFVASPTAVNITANSTVSSTIAANSLTLTTALGSTSGGTGKTTMTSQALLVGNTTNGYNELTLGADGFVLQSNGTAVIYSTLDGGSF